MSELEAEVGAPEAVDGNGQFDHFAPSGAVVVVEHEGAVLWHVGLTWTQTDAVLRGGGAERDINMQPCRKLHFTATLTWTVFILSLPGWEKTWGKIQTNQMSLRFFRTLNKIWQCSFFSVFCPFVHTQTVFSVTENWAFFTQNHFSLLHWFLQFLWFSCSCLCLVFITKVTSQTNSLYRFVLSTIWDHYHDLRRQNGNKALTLNSKAKCADTHRFLFTDDSTPSYEQHAISHDILCVVSHFLRSSRVI